MDETMNDSQRMNVIPLFSLAILLSTFVVVGLLLKFYVAR